MSARRWPPGPLSGVSDLRSAASWCGAVLAAFYDAKIAWSIATFGPGDRHAGILAHIRLELDEIAAKPDDLEEWIDVVLLAMDGAARAAGADGRAFVDALVAKDAKNRARSWPDWRTLEPGVPCRSDPAPRATRARRGRDGGRMTSSKNEGAAEFPPVLRRPGAVAGSGAPEMDAATLKGAISHYAVRGILSDDGVEQYAMIATVVDAVFAERDGLRGDLSAARLQLETVCRANTDALNAVRSTYEDLKAERDALHLALQQLTHDVESHECHAGPMPRMVAPPAAPERTCTACGHGESVHDVDADVCWADKGDGVLCICTSLLIVPDELDANEADAAADEEGHDISRVLWASFAVKLLAIVVGALVLVAAVVELSGCAAPRDPSPVLDAGRDAFPIGPRDLGDLGPCVGVNPAPFDACWYAALDAGWNPCPLHCACSLELDGGIACDGGSR